jgi:hypothetical protein
VVEPTNELKEEQMALRREELRILGDLSKLILKNKVCLWANESRCCARTGTKKGPYVLQPRARMFLLLEAQTLPP